MGIDLWNFQFLMEAHRRRGSFGDTLQIGRQEIHMGGGDYPFADALLRRCGIDLGFEQVRQGGRYADEGILQALGATSIHSADASAYEGATLSHDFNNPLDRHHYQTYDTVFDGGSLEHIFNIPVALANEMNLLKVGGWLLSSLPANNWLGHGFYQFSQELPFRVFTKANGFRLEAVFFSGMTEDHELYDVSDLARRSGGEFGRTGGANGLMFLARKIEQVVPFRRWPQQSDYNNEWDSYEASAGSIARRRSPPLSRVARLFGINV